MNDVKRPAGLLLLSVLLVILALRAVGWLVIEAMLAQQLPGGLIIVLSLLITGGLVTAAIGLWRLRPWARWLTLAAYSAYFGLMLANGIGLWFGASSTGLELGLSIMNVIVAVLVLAWAWWYLNHHDVRRLFKRPE